MERNISVNFRGHITWQKIMLNCGLYLAILCIFILFAVINPDFLTVRNMVNVFEQSAYYLVCAVGITFVLVSGANDMSVGSQVAFSSVVATLYLAAGGSIPASMGIMLGAALVIGLCNGLFVVVIGLPPFIGTIATGYVVRGVVAYYTKQETVTGLPRDYTALHGQRPLDYPTLHGLRFLLCFWESTCLNIRHTEDGSMHAEVILWRQVSWEST